MKSQGLPKSSLMRKPGEYHTVYRHGKRLRGRHFSLIYMTNETAENRLGISIHGIKGAVRRNRIKRIIRELFRRNRDLFPPFSDIIFAVRKEFSLNSLQELDSTVRSLCGKCGWLPKS